MLTTSFIPNAQENLVIQLYSMAGPQNNLPKMLQTILNIDRELIFDKLNGLKPFSDGELNLIHNNFKVSVPKD